MASRSERRRPVVFGCAIFLNRKQRPSTSNQEDSVCRFNKVRCGNPDPVRSDMLRQDLSPLRSAPAAETPNLECIAFLKRNVKGQKAGGPKKEKPPSAVLTVPEASEISTHKTDTTSNVSLTVGAVSSISAKENGRSDTHASECSSLAPYWIPEQIKHYFRHRHSQEEEDSSGKTDVALRAIGLERELPAIDDSSSSRWVQLDWCRNPQHALAATLGVMTGLLLGLLLAAVVADIHIALPGSRSRAGRLASPGDFLMPNQKVNNKQAVTPEDVITVRSPEGAEVTASAGADDVPPSGENATQLHSPAVFGLPGFSKWTGFL